MLQLPIKLKTNVVFRICYFLFHEHKCIYFSKCVMREMLIKQSLMNEFPSVFSDQYDSSVQTIIITVKNTMKRECKKDEV